MSADDISKKDLWAAFGVTRGTVGRRAKIAAAAIKAGHELKVSKSPTGRTRIECACGFSIPASWTLKHARDALVDHMIRAGRTALGETPLLGEIPPVGADTPLPAVNAEDQPEPLRQSS